MGLSSRGLRRFATSIPSIPGRILFNAEIPANHRTPLEQWAAKSKLKFDFLSLQDDNDPPIVDKGVAVMGKTQLRVAGETMDAMVCWLYRSNDRFNREFWDEQVRRLSDLIAEEYFANASSPSVFLMAHHLNVDDDSVKNIVEIGDHRLVTSVDAVRFFRNPFSGSVDLRIDAGMEDDRIEIDGTGDQYYSSSGGSKIGVSGFLPGRIVCNRPTVGSDFRALMNRVMRQHKVFMSTVLLDRRDAEIRAIAELGKVRSQRICMTAIPFGLNTEQQRVLATRPLAIPWEILPFHAGRIKLV